MLSIMKKFKLNPALKISKQDAEKYKMLPDNMPNEPLTRAQIDLVKDMYYRYITKNIDRASYGAALWETEAKERWPSGPRVKEYEAKRFILTQLVEINRRGNLTTTDAANYFLTWLDGREYVQKLLIASYRY